MPFILKKLGPDDVILAKQLFFFFQIDDGVTHPTIPSDNYVRSLLAKTDFHTIVALQNDNLIGGVTGYELEMYKKEVNEMFLYEIAVAPEYRQNGVASKLIESLKKICADKGINEMYVGTSTDNHPAMKLYKSTGGVEDESIAWFVYPV